MTFKVRMAGGKTGEVFLYDEIGGGFFGGIGAKQFVDDVNGLGRVDRINVRINSPGGDVFDGLTIFNFLKQHPAEIVVDVDGLAASIASVIAMAGDEIRMAKNAMLMIHEPFTMASGNAEDFRRKADLLDTVKVNLLDTYAERTKLPHAKLSELMAAETWFTAAEAAQNGFADSVTEELQMAACFDLSKFRNAPKLANVGNPGADLYRAKLVDMTKRAKARGAIPQ